MDEIPMQKIGIGGKATSSDINLKSNNAAQGVWWQAKRGRRGEVPIHRSGLIQFEKLNLT